MTSVAFQRSCQPVGLIAQSNRRSLGSWCIRLFVSAALGRPGIVGWSCTLPRKVSSLFLNSRTSAGFDAFMFLIYCGSKLKSFAPFTASDASVARRICAGALVFIGLGTKKLPLLPLLVKGSE